MRNLDRSGSAAARLLVVCLAAVIVQCAAQRFPYVRPVPKVDREQADRARAEDYFLSGQDYERRGLPQLAVRPLEMAYEFDQSSDVLRLRLAETYLELGKYPQAIIKIKNGHDVGALSEDEKDLLAAAYTKMGEYARAAETMERLKDPTPENIYSLALLYESLGQSDKAVNTYLRFVRMQPESPQAALKLAGLLLHTKHRAQADSLLTDLAARFGESSASLFLRGLSAATGGDTTAAIDRYRAALGADSTNEDALQALSQIYIQRKDYPKAIAIYERLYRSESYGEVYGKTLALLYYYAQQYGKALHLLKYLLGSAVDDYELHFYLGLVAADMDSADMARLEFEKSVALQGDNEDAWEQLCLVGLRAKDLDRAQADAERFVAALESKPSSWRMLGYVAVAQRKYADAIKALRRSLTIDSSQVRVWFELGSAHERLHEYDSAAVDFRRVLASQPRDPVTANYLGYMWADQGIKLDSARTLIEVALKEEPDNGAYLDSYAWVFYRQGDFTNAHVYIVKALEHIHDDAVVYEHLGDIQVKCGRLAAAVEAYEKSLALQPENPDAVRSKLQTARQGLGRAGQ